jgi:hypothetical protein
LFSFHFTILFSVYQFGEGGMATIHPELAEEWHKEKNGDITPHTNS